MARGSKAGDGLEPLPPGRALTTPARSFGKHPGGRPTLYDPIFCEQVVEFMRKGYSLTAFAGIIDVSKATLNVWQAEHPEFLDACSRGKAARLVTWETDAMNVAKRGGGPGTATVIVFGLKNMGGDDWNDRTQVELSGRNGGPVEVKADVNLSDLDQSERDLLRELVARRAAQSEGGAEGA